MTLVDYQRTPAQVPLGVIPSSAPLYTYVTAANGLFLRAERSGLKAQLSLADFPQPVRGLEPLTAYMHLPRIVPLKLLGQIIQISQQALPNEALFYLAHHRDTWRLIVPDQERTLTSVHPVDSFDAQENILIEIHSHNTMDAFFSSTDDAEESGFRIYGVLGRLDTEHPLIKMRLGVYGHFFPLSYRQVFGAPNEH